MVPVPEDDIQQSERSWYTLLSGLDTVTENSVLVAHALEVRGAARVAVAHLVEVKGQARLEHVVRALPAAAAPAGVPVPHRARVQILAQRQDVCLGAHVPFRLLPLPEVWLLVSCEGR
eukprot:CAMPEP_0175678158 /NCGR_PEP_ID=MMETSP0097-20121207/23625_1 /TAXON_ID=311494 /ORGANISM="Alexandrium monilatum, Strain CCMP3105" /LENGTH=117 /DNA_ID=CAMNT_0016984943 /DNA_START=199 /DNA_END=550 /DNA_ORIENTATION=+